MLIPLTDAQLAEYDSIQAILSKFCKDFRLEVFGTEDEALPIQYNLAFKRTWGDSELTMQIEFIYQILGGYSYWVPYNKNEHDLHFFLANTKKMFKDHFKQHGCNPEYYLPLSKFTWLSSPHG